MCGIYGIFSENISAVHLKQKTRNGLKLIKHRGPDETNLLMTDNFSAGVNRLSIEAINNGKQPIQDNNFIIGFNGEIFNYKKLIIDFNLKNIKSEIELLLILWNRFREKFIKYLKGQYAIFIYDKNEKNVYLFRDPFGIRPVFYSQTKNDFIFSSEIKAIINSNLQSHSIDENSIAQTSIFWTNIASQTSFKNILSLQPGHYLKFSKKKVEIKRFYIFPSLEKKISNKKVNLVEELKRCVDSQIHGEVEYGCYLSGGIDSSILAFLLSKKKKLNTFSVSFENDEYDESKYQNLLADKLNTKHLNLNITEKMISDNFEKTVEHAETLLFRTAPVPMYLLSKLVNKQKIKVVYSGEGADEVFFGYDIFFENRIRNFWKRNPKSKMRPQLLKNLYSYLPQFKNSRYFEMIKDFYKSNLEKDSIFYSHLVRWSQFKHVSSFFNLSSFNRNEDNLIENFNKNIPKEFLKINSDEKAQFIEISTLLSNYLLSSQGDRMTMANSVEGRYPFLDEDLILKSCLIGSQKLAPGIQSKKLFRESFKKYLPTEIINRPKIAYQAPEARSFINENFTSGLLVEFVDNIDKLEFINKKNFLGLISKLKDKNSSKRFGFRENMAFIMGLSYFVLNKSLKKWNNFG